MIAKSSLICGVIAAVAALSSCGGSRSSLAPVRAAQRLEQSPITSVFSHNDVNSPSLRDCYEAGPLPERAQRALITWLHNSTIKDFSYVYPQYYVTTTNAKGGGETVWGLCSDGQGNLVGVLVPGGKRTPAWELPTVGGYKVFVCETFERKALSDAIMESLADAGYDKVRIDTRKAMGVVDKNYLISKPLNEAEQRALEQERKATAKALEEAKNQAKKEEAAVFGSSSSDDDDEDISTSEDDSSSSSNDEDDSDSGSSDEDSGSSSDDDDSSSSSDDEDSSSDSDEDEDEE